MSNHTITHSDDQILVEPNIDAIGAVIWLHGLGADGNDFLPVVEELNIPDGLRFVFPHAEVRPVTINGGAEMRAWYDIVSLSGARNHDQKGIMQSVDQAWALVQRERERGIDAGRIVVAGFSQGGAIALQLALRYPERLSGLIALSTYLLLEDRLAAEAHPANADLPVFFGHGTADPMVPMQLGRMAADQVLAMGSPRALSQSVTLGIVSNTQMIMPASMRRFCMGKGTNRSFCKPQSRKAPTCATSFTLR